MRKMALEAADLSKCERLNNSHYWATESNFIGNPPAAATDPLRRPIAKAGSASLQGLAVRKTPVGRIQPQAPASAGHRYYGKKVADRLDAVRVFNRLRLGRLRSDVVCVQDAIT